MSTPAAKRRRLDAANVTLRKPFHSPLLRRPDAAGTSKSPEQTHSTAAEDVYSPSSSPSGRAIRPARSLGALRQTPLGPSSPLNFKKPSQRSGVKRTEPASGAAVEQDDGNDDHPGGALLALVRAHRHTAQDAVLRDLDRKLGIVRQAKRIEEASEGERPGEAVDQELRDLVVKWKSASRMAADEVFEIVRERVAKYVRAPPAYLNFFFLTWRTVLSVRIYADDNVANIVPVAPRRGRRCARDRWNSTKGGIRKMRERRGQMGMKIGMVFKKSLKVMMVVRLKRKRCRPRNGRTRTKKRSVNPSVPPHSSLVPLSSAGTDIHQEFNMAQMLQSLNIDTSLLGYDEVEEKWID